MFICAGHLHYLPAFIICGRTILGFVSSAARKVGVVWGKVGVVLGKVGVVWGKVGVGWGKVGVGWARWVWCWMH